MIVDVFTNFVIGFSGFCNCFMIYSSIIIIVHYHPVKNTQTNEYIKL